MALADAITLEAWDIAKSSRITRVEYASLDGDMLGCVVQFTDGVRVFYPDIEYDDIQQFVKAPSAGKWFEKNLKNKIYTKL